MTGPLRCFSSWGRQEKPPHLVISFRHYCFWEMWGTWGKAVFTALPRRLWSELAADTVPLVCRPGPFHFRLWLLPVLSEQRLQGMQIKPGFDPMTSPKISLGWRILSEKEEQAFGDSSGEHIENSTHNPICQSSVRFHYSWILALY